MHPIHPLPNISIIVAMAQNRAIGKDNDLLWHLSADLKRFKALTTGHTVVMGRSTYESLPKRPLPNRRNIVLSHREGLTLDGAEVAASLAEVLRLTEGEDEVFVIGGASVYARLLPFANRLYVTHVHRDFEGDVYFPVVDRSQFRVVDEQGPMHDEPSGLDYSYCTYERCAMPVR